MPLVAHNKLPTFERLRELGHEVLTLLGAANRDPEQFDDPEQLDVTRKNVKPASFGGGIHYCLGAQLARLELRVLFEELLARLPEIALAAPDTPLPRRRGNFVLGYESMPVVFEKAT